MSVPEIHPNDVADELMLDVREDDEWSTGRAPNSIHIPLYDLPDRFAEIPQDRPLNVVCKVGSRSAQATAWLIANGVEARNVSGGMLLWAQLGLPVVGDGPRPWIA